MFETRRRFSAMVATVGLVAIVGLLTEGATVALVGSGLGPLEGAVVAGQQAPLPPGMPKPPAPAEPGNQDKDAPPQLDSQAVKRAQLRRNEKEFREGVVRLYQLSSELRDEVAQTPTSQVLSVRMYKKTEEIEKLAKRLKGTVKQ
jgi:hypothetical protein